MYKLRDSYHLRAKREGYPARSVYKLKEIDEKFRILARRNRVLDLGCAPGSWLKYIVSRIGEKGKAIGIDLHALGTQLPRGVTFIQTDIFKLSEEELLDQVGPVQVLLSDMAPATCGSRFVDQQRSHDLASRALDIADSVLMNNGRLVIKLLQGESTQEFITMTRKKFKKVKMFKPEGTRKGSTEIFLVALGFIRGKDLMAESDNLQTRPGTE